MRGWPWALGAMQPTRGCRVLARPIQGGADFPIIGEAAGLAAVAGGCQMKGWA